MTQTFIILHKKNKCYKPNIAYFEKRLADGILVFCTEPVAVTEYSTASGDTCSGMIPTNPIGHKFDEKL